jgi:hypothetical protein
MIGVIADFAEQDVVREFFELFKTPWEFYRKGRQYDVVVCAGDARLEGCAKLVLHYAGRRTQRDDERNVQTGHLSGDSCIASYQGNHIPIYGAAVTFPEGCAGLLTEEDSRQCLAFLERSEDHVTVRIGYDLFSEIRKLLEVGQPPANADMPALELHIAFLRDLITGSGLPLVEIPPFPDGYRFIACLTHDIDHPSIRQHQWDHTTLGFLRRATFGSLCNFLRARLSGRDLLVNWVAALKVPLVLMGLARDFWRDFGERYLEVEDGLHSTFFVIPFKNRPGSNVRRPSPGFRAARYGAQDVADTIQKLLAAGCEIGLHGIDAWLDAARGREELEEIRRLTGVSEIGVRMHWLCFDQQSPLALEIAGASYDSTVGYNETVGYRAGTTQAYKPLEASHLLELPLHVMDTAMFYPVYLGVSPRQAKTLLTRMADNAARFGGCLTINWHDRSLAPERLWGAIYSELLQDLKARGAWLAPAGQTVAWFQKRRAVVFETDSVDPHAVRAKVAAGRGDNLPGLRLRTHRLRASQEFGACSSEGYFDMPFDEGVDWRAPHEVSE